MKHLACLLALSALSPLALADSVETYHYGMHLDIAEVISQSLPHGCEVGEARMVYLDSQGQQHTLVYLRQGDDCNY